MNKHKYGILFLASFFAPILATLLAGMLFPINAVAWFCLATFISVSMAAEVNYTYQEKKLIWPYIATSLRNKLAYSISLIILFFLISLPSQINMPLSQQNRLLLFIASLVFSAVIFLLISDRELKAAMFQHRDSKETGESKLSE